MILDTNNKYKNYVIIALVGVVMLVLLFRKCGGNGGGKSVKVDTFYKKEIVYQTSYIPKLDTVFLPTKQRFLWDTMWAERLVLDTSHIEYGSYVDTCNYTEFYSTRVYKDTIRNQYGYVAIKDTISQNQLKGRSAKSDFNIPVITRTITLTQPKRNQLYFGAGMFGSETDLLKGYEAGMLFKTRKDRILALSYNQTWNGDHFYKAGLYFKLSFRK